MENSEIPTEEKDINRSSKFQFSGLKHYFFEFLMVFLGITAGFFVDEFRESRSERSEEVDYIKSYLKDLEKDRTELEYNSEFGRIPIWGADSLIKELLRRPIKGREKRFYHFLILASGGFGFPHHDRTITQLKYSGKFRVIRNQMVAEALIDYDSKLTLAIEATKSHYRTNISNNCWNGLSKVFDLAIIHPLNNEVAAHINDIDKVNYPSDLHILNTDESVLMQVRNFLVQAVELEKFFLKENNELLKVNKALDSLIHKEYFEGSVIEE